MTRPSPRGVAGRIAAMLSRGGALGPSLLMLLTAAVSRGMIVVATIVLSHMLDAASLGRALYFLTTSAAGSILIAQGSSSALLAIVGRMLPHRRRAASRALVLVFAFALAIAAVLSAVLVAAGPALARQLADLGGAIYALLALSVAMQGLTAMLLGLIAGLRAYRTQSLLAISGALVQYGALLAGTATGGIARGLTFFVVTLALSLAVTAIAVIRLAARERLVLAGRLLSFGRRRAFNRGILGFALMTTLGALLFEPVNWLCVSLLLAHPDGPAQVAAFLAANQWFAIILFVPINLTQITLPLVSRAFAETGRILGTAARRMLAISLAASGAVGLALLLAMPLLLRLYSPAIASARPVFTVIAVNGMIVAIQVATGQMLIASGRVRANLLFNLGWALIYTALAHGIVTDAFGLASARLASYIVHALGVLAFLAIIDRRTAASQARFAS